MDERQKEKVFQFLNELRESAVTNMYGARPYLMQEFGFDKKEAKEWLTAWMRSFE